MAKISNFDIFERVKNLPAAFVKDLMLLPEGVILCGSTALYLRGELDRLPNDIDVIADGKLAESLSLTEAKKYDKLPAVGKTERFAGVSIAIAKLRDMAMSCDTAKAFIEAVAYHVAGEKAGFKSSKFTKAELRRLTEIYEYTKNAKAPKANESVDFTYVGSGCMPAGTGICVFEATASVKHDEMNVLGRNMLVESADLVHHYRRAFGKTLDESAGTELTKAEIKSIILLNLKPGTDRGSSQAVINVHDIDKAAEAIFARITGKTS